VSEYEAGGKAEATLEAHWMHMQQDKTAAASAVTLFGEESQQASCKTSLHLSITAETYPSTIKCKPARPCLLVLHASWLGGPHCPQPWKVRWQAPLARQLMATLPSAATLSTQLLHGSRLDTGGSTMDDTGAASSSSRSGRHKSRACLQRVIAGSYMLLHSVS
jgi:hypothetical protein